MQGRFRYRRRRRFAPADPYSWSRTLKSLLLCGALALTLALPARAGNLQDRLARADQSFERQDWKRYAAIYQELAERHPGKGLYWYRLGNGDRKLGRLAAAIAAFDKARALGYQRASAERWLATLEAERGNGEQAVRWFEQARRDHLVNAELTLMQDSNLNALSKDGRYGARLFPVLPAGASAHDKWRADLAFLDLRVRESHWNLFGQVDASRWEAAVAGLNADLPRLADWQIQIRMNELLRLAKSGHSWVLPGFDGPDAFHAARIRLAAFADGRAVPAGADGGGLRGRGAGRCR